MKKRVKIFQTIAALVTSSMMMNSLDAGTIIKDVKGDSKEYDIVSINENNFTAFEVKKTELLTIEWSTINMEWLEKEQPKVFQKYVEAKRQAVLNQSRAITKIKGTNGTIVEFRINEVYSTHFTAFVNNNPEPIKVEWSKVDLVWLAKENKMVYDQLLYARKLEAMKKESILANTDVPPTKNELIKLAKTKVAELKSSYSDFFAAVDKGSFNDLKEDFNFYVDTGSITEVIKKIEAYPKYKEDAALSRQHTQLKTIVEFIPKVAEKDTAKVYNSREKFYQYKVLNKMNSDARFKINFALKALESENSDIP